MPDKKPPADNRYDPVYWATLEAESRRQTRQAALKEKYGDSVERVVNGNSAKYKAATNENRVRAAEESRLNAQGRAWQIGQQNTPAAKAKKAAIQAQINAALKKAAGK